MIWPSRETEQDWSVKLLRDQAGGDSPTNPHPMGQRVLTPRDHFARRGGERATHYA